MPLIGTTARACSGRRTFGVPAALNELRRSITLETRPSEIAQWDSLGHALLERSLDHEFNISFDIDELMALENVREIIRVVRAKLDAAG